MDSVTQFALGSAVGMACLGRKIGPRKAALAGGLLGTMPDLDVYIPVDDPVDSFVSHRGATHSLVIQAIATPLIGEGLRLVSRELRDKRMLVYLAVYLCLATHALLDGMTVYGTRLLWPVWPEPVGLGSIFIIDPLYTLPLALMFIAALFFRSWTQKFQQYLTLSLALSTLYLGWSALAQQTMQARAMAFLDQSGIKAERVLTIPTPFNTLFWRAIVMTENRYLNVYLPVLGGQDRISIYAHDNGADLAGCLKGNASYEKVARFSDGFYRVERRNNFIAVTDLRMGLTPSYAFRFLVAEQGEDDIREIPSQRKESDRPLPGDLDWLLAGFLGQDTVRPVEQAFRIDPEDIGPENMGNVMLASDHQSCSGHQLS